MFQGEGQGLQAETWYRTELMTETETETAGVGEWVRDGKQRWRKGQRASTASTGNTESTESTGSCVRCVRAVSDGWVACRW